MTTADKIKQAGRDRRAAERNERAKVAKLQRLIVAGRTKDKLSYKELAKLSGLSEIRVSQILSEGGATKSRTVAA